MTEQLWEKRMTDWLLGINPMDVVRYKKYNFPRESGISTFLDKFIAQQRALGKTIVHGTLRELYLNGKKIDIYGARGMRLDFVILDNFYKDAIDILFPNIVSGGRMLEVNND